MFKKTRKSRLILVLCVSAVLLSALGISPALAQKRFEGVELPYLRKPLPLLPSQCRSLGLIGRNKLEEK